MLGISNWLRMSRHASDLLATLAVLRNTLETGSRLHLGPPHSAVAPLCRRCWIYQAENRTRNFCPICSEIQTRQSQFFKSSQQAAVIRGHVNFLPAPVTSSCAGHPSRISDVSCGLLKPACWIQDPNHFWVILKRHDVRAWLQELAFHHGSELKGDLQIFSAILAMRPGTPMGDILLSAEKMEAERVRQDVLQVRFLGKAAYLLLPANKTEAHSYQAVLSDFIAFMEMANLYRKLFHPNEQEQILELLRITDIQEKKFFWGRLLGQISSQASEMLERWQVMNWSPHKIKVFEELLAYAFFR